MLKAARYLEEKEAVEFGEIHAFVGPEFVVRMRYGEASGLGGVRQWMEDDPDLVRKGPFAVLYTIMDRVVSRSPASRSGPESNPGPRPWSRIGWRVGRSGSCERRR